jgi:hypothetical protein
MMMHLNLVPASQANRRPFLSRNIKTLAALACLGLSACQTAVPTTSAVPSVSQPALVAPATMKPLLRNMDFKLWVAQGTVQCAAEWVCGQHTGPLSYLFVHDKTVTKSGTGSASLERTGPEDWGTMWQDADFRAIAGRKVRISADIKRAAIVGRGGGLSFVSGGASLTEQAPIADKFIQGSNDWQREEIVLTLPRSITSARVGFALEGSGKIWVDNFVFEILPN